MSLIWRKGFTPLKLTTDMQLDGVLSADILYEYYFFSHKATFPV